LTIKNVFVITLEETTKNMAALLFGTSVALKTIITPKFKYDVIFLFTLMKQEFEIKNGDSK